MSWIKEFRELAVKGNAVDLAVAVINGAAFPGVEVQGGVSAGESG